jgi:hypothetical protein
VLLRRSLAVVRLALFAEIGCVAAFGDVSHSDKEHGVGSFLFAVSLCESSNFIGIGTCLLQGTFAALTEFAVLSKFTSVGIERVSVPCGSGDVTQARRGM